MKICRSTIDCCFCLVNEIFKSYNAQRAVLVVFVDLAKAFNTVNHSFFLEKMWNMGFSGNLLRLLARYLQNKRQIVNLSGVCSEQRYNSWRSPARKYPQPHPLPMLYKWYIRLWIRVRGWAVCGWHRPLCEWLKHRWIRIPNAKKLAKIEWVKETKSAINQYMYNENYG